MKKLFITALLLGLMFILWVPVATIASTGDTESGIGNLSNVSKIEVEAPDTQLHIDGTMELSVKGFNQNEEVFEQLENLVFEVSDETIATVNENGIIHPKAEGKVTIIVKLGDIEDTIQIEVISNEKSTSNKDTTQELNSISLTASKSQLTINEETELTVSGTNQQGNQMEVVSSIDFQTSNSSIVTIDKNGSVLAKQEGTVTVTASTADLSDSITLTITKSDEASSPSNSSGTDETNPSDEDGSVITPEVPETGDGSSKSSFNWTLLGWASVIGMGVVSLTFWYRHQLH